MRRTLALVLLGLFAYGAFLVATMPAAFVAGQVDTRTNGAVRLIEPQGTAWRGESRASIATAPGARLEIERLQWRLEPAALAAGRLAFALEARAPGLEARGEAARALGEWQLRDVSARTDAARLAQAVPFLAAWKPEGPVRLVAPHLAFDGSELRGEASLEWREAALSLSAVRPLGSYRLEANAASGPGKLALTTTSGPLRLSGQGTFAYPRSITFDGSARAEGAEAAALDPLLDLFGPRRADGTRALSLRAP